MVRKRTLQDMAYPLDDAGSTSSTSTSPHSLIPSFEFDPAHGHGSHSSPFSVSTLASSPMSLSFSNSSQGSFASSSGDADYDYELVEEHELLEGERPEMKRRRTAPDVMDGSPPHSMREESLSPSDKRGNGKDGQDVWPQDAEDAFHTALSIIPKLGRKKVMVHGKPCGRNELIADYIRRKTGKIRTRKQVSSHIQVLKNMRKHDVEFMNLVSEPLEGEDTFAPGAALAFFGLSPPAAPGSSPMGVSYSDSLLSPYSSSFLQRSMSASSSASSQSPHSPAFPDYNPHSPRIASAPMSATSSITSALREMHFPIPPPHERAQASCPIAPAALCLWADDAETDALHVFAELMHGGRGPTDTVYLDEIASAEREFPGLGVMFDHLPCQFLHTRINLDIPTIDSATIATQLHTQLTLTSLQDLSLTSVIRIYSFGHEVLSLQEQLEKPGRITPATSPTTSEPPTPGSSAGSPTTNPLRHKYSYQAPFASDFWSIFLRGAFSSDGGKMLPSFAKVGDERSAFIMAISGLSVIQEFVVRSDEPSALLIDGQDISPGSGLGDVVLVVTYDFECRDDPNDAGLATVSFLAGGTSPPSTPAVTRVQHSALATTRAGPSSVDVLAPSHRPHGSPTKPNLSLRIPPPPAVYAHPSHGLASGSPGVHGPITPWPQMLHTPREPPPFQESSDDQRERLNHLWARDSNQWELDSPALLGAFPGAVGGPAMGSHHAMNDMTSNALAAGSPHLEYPQHAYASSGHHGAPFIHPSHGYPQHEELLDQEPLVKLEDGIDGRNETVKQTEVDFFTSLLGPSRYGVAA
ncbi:hypothetical protein RQP46_000572 [Phenoliferia psychrophenolica]